MCNESQHEFAIPTAPRAGGFLRSGLTLAELVVSVAIMSVLVVGISSAMVIAARAIEQPHSPSACIRQANDFSQQLTNELASAVGVLERTENTITIDVPDRNQDGNSERIRYMWDAIPGVPVTRTYNDEGARTILDNVYAFNLRYMYTNTLLPDTGSQARLLAEENAPTDLSTYQPGNQNWVCQSFCAELPPNITSWQITRVAIQCRNIGVIGASLTLQLLQAQGNGLPTANSYAQTTASASTIPSTMSWQTFGFTGCPALGPGQKVCLVLRGNVSAVCEVRYHTRDASKTNWYYSTSNNAGTSWTTSSAQALQIMVHGTITGPGGQAPQTRTVLSAILWEAQVGDDPGNLINGGAQIANLPE